MLVHSFNHGVWVTLVLAGLAHAHIAAFTDAMYCFNGTVPGEVNINNNLPTHPLYMMTHDEYWLHAFDNCTKFPPEEGKFLEIPSGSSFEVELADNRAVTTWGGPHAHITNWGDGKEHPDNYTGNPCITSPNLHTHSSSTVAGSAFAIAYESDINKVNPNNTIVFSVNHYAPWQRTTKYDVPAGMPPCPEGGCHCVWAWIPGTCGERNIFLFPYKCNVISDGTPPKTIGDPQPAVWCGDDPSKCVRGPKQLMIWHQLEGNNIEVEGYDEAGNPKNPGYNTKCGFDHGAQNDMFVDSGETMFDASNGTTASNTATTPNTSTPSRPSGSTTPTDPGLPSRTNTTTASGTPTLSRPAGCVTPSADPSQSGASSTPAYSNSNAQTGSDAPSGSPTGSILSSGALPASTPTCGGSSQSTAGTRRAAHSRRMMHEKRPAGAF